MVRHSGDIAGESGAQKAVEVLPNSTAITFKLSFFLGGGGGGGGGKRALS